MPEGPGNAEGEAGGLLGSQSGKHRETSSSKSKTRAGEQALGREELVAKVAGLGLTAGT